MMKTPNTNPPIVGPNYVQVLQGSILGRNNGNSNTSNKISLILCGESHEDAIDATRRGGVFEGDEGWVSQTAAQMFFTTTRNHPSDAWCIQLWATTPRHQTLERVQEWAEDKIFEEDDEDDPVFGQIALLFEVKEEARGLAPSSRGTGYLMRILPKKRVTKQHNNDKPWHDIRNLNDAANLPTAVKEWISPSQNDHNKNRYQSFEWGDLDQQAFELNQQRLFGQDEIPTDELDRIIRQRKAILQSNIEGEPLWTFDDWLAHVREQFSDQTELHLILEASIPPWQLSLHRPSPSQAKTTATTAAECIRQVPPDEEPEEQDDDGEDPASDGIGTYLDFVYRRFMEEQILLDNSSSSPQWVHCVDGRDLGCASATHSPTVQKMWEKQLLTDEERERLLNKDGGVDDDEAMSATPNVFVPDSKRNPEQSFLRQLQSENKLVVPGGDEDDDATEMDSDEEEEEELTFPSFEGFFGQATEYLYYSPHVHLSYAPFLAKCVGSMNRWHQFFTSLFFDGATISEALQLLTLTESTLPYAHVRSPLCMLPGGRYHARSDGEHYITYPYFPHEFYLTDKDSDRTISSNLYHRLSSPETNELAKKALEWTLKRIKQCCADPKQADDEECGGEWFEAYLRAFHRDIYNDIDRSDSAQLLQRATVKSISNRKKKYNLDQISIPSMADGFDTILKHFENDEHVPPTPQVETMAKILLDIYVSNLLDYVTILQIAHIVASHAKSTMAENKHLVICCYMGSAHTRAVANFFQYQCNFKQRSFSGKTDWDDDEKRTIQLPGDLWNLPQLVAEQSVVSRNGRRQRRGRGKGGGRR